MTHKKKVTIIGHIDCKPFNISPVLQEIISYVSTLWSLSTKKLMFLN